MNTNNIFGTTEVELKIDWPDWLEAPKSDWSEIGEVQPTNIIVKDTLIDSLLSDQDLAEWLNDACQNWVREISDWEWWSIIVPDYQLRLKAITTELKLKWHFREKRVRNELIDWIYVMN